ALYELATTWGWRKQDSKVFPAALWPTPSCTEIDILGPSFTGSAQSLDLVLSHWLDSLPEPRPGTEITLIAGSGTGISVRPLDAQAAEDPFDFQNFRSRLGARFQFRSMENRDSLTVPGFMRYLGGQQCGASGHAVKVALLIEG